MGPIGHLADERERLAGLKFRTFDVAPMSATIGAEISGVDLTTELDDEVITELYDALLAYKAIFFRDQPLTPAQHVAFARRFGELEIHPFIPGNGEFPELVHFEKGADVGGYENSWHHDVTWREVPSKAAILHAIQVPVTGGDTLFADMCAAYDGLDGALKARIDGMTAVHDFMRSFGSQVPEERRAEMRAQYPLVEHPVVRTHPDTGRKMIFVNRIFTDHIVGLEPEESRAHPAAEPPGGDPRVPVPVPVDARLRGDVGQPLVPALRVQRLLAVGPHHGARQHHRRAPRLTRSGVTRAPISALIDARRGYSGASWRRAAATAAPVAIELR